MRVRVGASECEASTGENESERMNFSTATRPDVHESCCGYGLASELDAGSGTKGGLSVVREGCKDLILQVEASLGCNLENWGR